MKNRVERLLHAYDESPGFLESPPLNGGTVPTIVQFATAQPGVQIGCYRLVHKIGEGGMGSVWTVDQISPIKRRVAMKLIRVDRGDSRMILSRFEAERQAIALMDHPNIARLLDAGSTDDGQPYFVMELVQGVPLIEYCDANHLNVPKRLELFLQICSAVQHAHQKGIVHRDLKPTNILVEIIDGQSVPKVIDFGLAKATSGIQLSSQTLVTTIGSVMGTPTYMAPEQATFDAVDVDTRADVYSLGVILFELLTGTTPITGETAKTVGLGELLKRIREQEAPRPSTRISVSEATTVIAANRDIESVRLTKLLRGDLDWIVLKALEKDRSRRYETANGLAADIRRYSANEPVSARPPSSIYRLQKLIRRNQLAFAAGSAIAAALVIGLTVSVWQGSRAMIALNELRAAAPAFAAQARGLVAEERFNEALERLAYASTLRPDVPEYLVSKGDLLECQLRLDEAVVAYRAALDLDPENAQARAGLDLCEELLAAPSGKNGKLSNESLGKLHRALQQQQRSAVELMPVARLIGKEKAHAVDYWRARLSRLPISTEKPLKKRLTGRDDGLLFLDLSRTQVTDLSPLAGAPLVSLDVSGIKGLKDISAVRGMRLTRLVLSGTSIADLSPLGGMTSLEQLMMSSTQVSDLSPLRGLKLKKLDLTSCPVHDLSPLRGVPLEEILLRATHVTDISPLKKMPLKNLDLKYTPVLDFRPLAGLPLERCNLQYDRIRDLSVFRGMPLRELVLFGCRDARNYSVLNEIKTLELLLLPSEYRELPERDFTAIAALRNHPRMRQLGSEVMDRMDAASTGSTEEFWRDWDREQAFVPALRQSGFKFSLTKLPGGTYQLNFQGQPLSDLSILRGAPISELSLDSCRVTDLSPIKDLRLRSLNLSGNPVENLASLQGMLLEELTLARTNVADLSPLVGLPLKNLYLQGCRNVADVSVIASISTLEKVTVPTMARNIELLRKLPKLTMLDYEVAEQYPYAPASTAEAFWNDLATNHWLSHLRESGIEINALKKLPDRTWYVDLENSTIRDLAFLKGAPISKLWLGNTGVSDLTPLSDMVLTELRLYHTQVTDLSPLKGMPINYLHLSGTRITDISALREMPLVTLRMHDCFHLIDLQPLSGIATLRNVTLPPRFKNIESLRALSDLELIGFKENADYFPDMTAAEFWKEFDAQKN